MGGWLISGWGIGKGKKAGRGGKVYCDEAEREVGDCDEGKDSNVGVLL